jgi:transposase-like protein
MTQAENRQKWEARVAAYQASGQSSAEWCAAHQVERRQLWYWLRKFKNTKNAMSPDPQWVSVNVDKQLKESESILLVRVGAASIEVKTDYNPALLANVVRTLQTLC